jgi:hypothetical protein
MFDPYYEWLGIPPSQQPANHYRLLGVPRFETNIPAIAAAADQRLALVACHQGGPRDGEARRLIALLNDARACLTDAHRKMEYDDSLHAHVGGRPGYVPMRPPIDALLPPGVAPTVSNAKPLVRAKPLPAAVPLPSVIEEEFAPNNASKTAQPPEGDGTADAPDDAAGAKRRIWLIAGALVAVVVALSGVTGVTLIVFAQRGASVDQPPAADAENEEPLPINSTAGPFVDEAEVVRPNSSGELLFTPVLAQTFGIGLELESRDAQSVLSGWTSTDTYAEWTFELDKPGYYTCEITYSAVGGGGKYVISADDAARPVSGTVRSGGTGGMPATDSKLIAFRTAGRKTLQMRATEVPGEELMTLYSIRLAYDAAKSRRP